MHPPVTPPESGTEIIPGYRLRSLLGRGGFGEVWEADGPGGITVAVKLVPLAGRLAGPDLRSLQLLQVLRHPSLITVHGVWMSGGHLVMVMERARGTLADVFRDFRAAGRPGIPRPELLGWMIDVARGLDYLNEPGTTPEGLAKPAIVHRDVKPPNILLVGAGARIGDFGLARVLEEGPTGHSGALTPAFAAPEFFRGQTTRTSDQYSLAVTYCQLVGGRVPFAGAAAEVMAGHLQRRPELPMLPEHDRAAVERALDKDPGRRWPTCEAFVAALLRAAPHGPARSGAPGPEEDFSVGPVPTGPGVRPAVAQTTEVRPARGPRSRRRRRDLLIGVGVAAVLTLTAGGFGLGGRDQADAGRGPAPSARRDGVAAARVSLRRSAPPPDADPAVRPAAGPAAGGFARMAAEAEYARPGREGDPSVLVALCCAGRAAPAVVDLAAALGSPHADERLAAVRACGALGGGLSGRLKGLLAGLLGDPDRAVRERAAAVLMAVDPAEACRRLGL